MSIKYFSTILILTGILFFSCGQNKKNIALLKEINEATLEGTQSDIQNTDSIVSGKTKLPTYDIDGEDIFIRRGPSEKFDRIVNEKASSVSTVTQYIQVDYSVKVIIIETNGNWSKIKVVDPSWLTDTHIGWIPTKKYPKSYQLKIAAF